MRSSEPAHFVVETQIQTDAAEEPIGFHQLRLVGNQLGRAAAGQGPSKHHLRRPIESVQITEAIKRRPPRTCRHVRHARRIAMHVQAATGKLDRQSLHGRQLWIGRLFQFSMFGCRSFLPRRSVIF